MSSLEGQVAFITGAGRGQGRSHAEAPAERGVDIIAVDLCDDIDTVSYPSSNPSDLDETAAAVKAHGRRVVTYQADVRDMKGLSRAVVAEAARVERLHRHRTPVVEEAGELVSGRERQRRPRGQDQVGAADAR